MVAVENRDYIRVCADIKVTVLIETLLRELATMSHAASLGIVTEPLRFSLFK
jgi:hypothetical protein